MNHNFKVGDTICTPSGKIGVINKMSSMGFWGRLDTDSVEECRHDLKFSTPAVKTHSFTFGQRITCKEYPHKELYYVTTLHDDSVLCTTESEQFNQTFGNSWRNTLSVGCFSVPVGRYVPYVEPEVKPTGYTVAELEAKLGEKIVIVSED